MLTVFSPHWWVHLLVIPSCHPSLTSEHSFLAFQYDQRLSRNPPALQHNTGTSKASSLMDATATVSLVCLSSVQTAAVGLHSPCHVANLTNPLCNIYIPPITSPLENLTHRSVWNRHKGTQNQNSSDFSPKLPASIFSASHWPVPNLHLYWGYLHA